MKETTLWHVYQNKLKTPKSLQWMLINALKVNRVVSLALDGWKNSAIFTQTKFLFITRESHLNYPRLVIYLVFLI